MQELLCQVVGGVGDVDAGICRWRSGNLHLVGELVGRGVCFAERVERHCLAAEIGASNGSGYVIHGAERLSFGLLHLIFHRHFARAVYNIIGVGMQWQSHHVGNLAVTGAHGNGRDSCHVFCRGNGTSVCGALLSRRCAIGGVVNGSALISR